jgi:2-keto-4-pentenoate hydratase/2-oxohepta-3-ene-1,7-dioic acid hydratase in catechol pathway
MKYCRFLFEGQTHYGRVDDSSGELWIVETIDAPEEDLAYRVEHGHSARLNLGFEPLPLRNAELLPPVTPSKIVCVGRNYSEHIKELGNEMRDEPVLFLKPLSCLLSPGGAIVLPRLSERVDFEGELALVIGKRTRKLPIDGDWRSVIRGCTLANDISARDLQKRDVQFTRAKGCDTFGPVGPIVSDELDLGAPLNIQTRLNGELRQNGSTADFIFSIPYVLSYISAALTLEPGDLVLTGTPSGTGPLKPGDHVEVTIAGLGTLSNTVQADTD